MPTGEPSTSVYLPQLVAELPDGWTVSEGMTISSPSGTKIRVSLDHAPPGVSSEELTKTQLSLATSELDDLNDGTASPIIAFGGLDGHERSFSFARDGVSFQGLIASAVIGDLAVSSGASWSADQDDKAMVRSVLQGLHLIGRPTLADLIGAGAGADSDNGTKDTTAPTGQQDDPAELNDPAIWAELVEKWSEPRQPSSLDPATRWSEEELAVAAALDGTAAAFPTVGPDLLEGVPATARDAVVATVVRSFAARSLLQIDDGTFNLTGKLEPVVRCALGPGLTVTIERTNRAEHLGYWFGVGLDETVQVDILVDGTRACSVLPSADLVEQILAVSGLEGSSGTTESESRDMPSEVSLADVLAGSSTIDAVVQIQTTWRDGAVQVGGILTVALSAGVPAFAESVTGETGSWRIEPTDLSAVRCALVEHLPLGIQQS